MNDLESLEKGIQSVKRQIERAQSRELLLPAQAEQREIIEIGGGSDKEENTYDTEIQIEEAPKGIEEEA